jgi:hypothetical protein
MWSACATRARRALCSGTESFSHQGRPSGGRQTEGWRGPICDCCSNRSTLDEIPLLLHCAHESDTGRGRASQQHRRASHHAQNIGDESRQGADDQIVTCPERDRSQQQHAQDDLVGLHSPDGRKGCRSRRQERRQSLPSQDTGQRQHRHQRVVCPAQTRQADKQDRHDCLHAHQAVHGDCCPMTQQRVMHDERQICCRYR